MFLNCITRADFHVLLKGGRDSNFFIEEGTGSWKIFTSLPGGGLQLLFYFQQLFAWIMTALNYVWKYKLHTEKFLRENYLGDVFRFGMVFNRVILFVILTLLFLLQELWNFAWLSYQRVVILPQSKFFFFFLVVRFGPLSLNKPLVVYSEVVYCSV